MLQRILPRTIDNRYRGRKAALWLFAIIVLLNLVISLSAIFAADGRAQSADGIPLNTYGPAAAAAVIGVVAFLGLSDLFLCFFYVLALFRYRAMIPLMYLVLVVQYPCHKAIGWMKPIARAGPAPGGYVTAGLMALTVVGLLLSLQGRGYTTDESSG